MNNIMSKKEDILRECIKKCKACILHCTKMKGMNECINTCSDCIICCDLCLKYNFTNKELYNNLLKLCIKACNLCISACKIHKDDDFCKKCVVACKDCKIMCNNLI